jgi:hypothetical protein
MQTKIKKNTRDRVEPLRTFLVDETCIFDFGKSKIPFAPLFNVKILNATITSQQANENDQTIEFTLTSDEIINDFSGATLYIEGADALTDIEIAIDQQTLPIIRPDDYSDLPFTDWFHNHLITSGENQLQMGCYDYWQELFLKNQLPLFLISEYSTKKIPNNNLSPVFTIRFKNLPPKARIQDYTIQINCLPVVNALKQTVYLTDDEPIKKLSDENAAFLHLLYNTNTDTHTNDYLIRHFGVERYSQKDLLFQLNDLFNRYISDYYAFRDIEELKKGEKLEAIYRTFKELLPVIKKDNDDIHPSVYAILKLGDRIDRPTHKVEINYITTHGALANGFKKGEKPFSTSNFLDKDQTVLITETGGGRNEERNEDNLNHLARYSFLTKDRLLTASDLKAFCYRELQQKIRQVSVQNTGEQIRIIIRMKEDYMMSEQEKDYHERLIQEKIKIRSLLSLPVQVIVTA